MSKKKRLFIGNIKPSFIGPEPEPGSPGVIEPTPCGLPRRRDELHYLPALAPVDQFPAEPAKPESDESSDANTKM